MGFWTDVTRRFGLESLVPVSGDGHRVGFPGNTSQPFEGIHLRAAATPHTIVVIGQHARSNAGTPVVNDAGAQLLLPGAAHGTHCVGAKATDAEHVRVWWLLADFRLATTLLHARTLTRIGDIEWTPAARTSQGFLDVDPIVWTDPNRIRTLIDADGLALRYTLWQATARWIVGQGQDVGGVLAFHRGLHRHFRVSDVPTQLPPRIADLPDGRAVVAISFGDGVLVGSETFVPYLAPIDPPPPPPPPPDPEPEEPSMSIMSVEEVKQFVLAHPAQERLGLPVGRGPGFDTRRSQTAFRFCNQVVLDLEDRGVTNVGIMTKAHGNNAFGYSVDHIAIKVSGGIDHFDIVIASESEAAVVGWGEAGRLPDWSEFQTGRPDLAFDSGAGDPPVDPPEDPPVDPPPPPSPDQTPDAALLQVLTEMAENQQTLQRGLGQVAQVVMMQHQLVDAMASRLKLVETMIAGISGSKGFTGTVRVPYLGSAPVDLVPKA